MNSTMTTTTSEMINMTALAVITFDSCESNFNASKDALNKQLAEMKQAGVPMAINTYSPDGKLEKKAAMQCPTRKALRLALSKGGMSEKRIDTVVHLLSLYYATGVPVASLSKVEDTVKAIGLDKLQKLRAIKPNSSATLKGSSEKGLMPTEQAGKAAEAAASVKPVSKGRMPKLTPIWGLYDALMAHEDAPLFTQWMQSDRKQTLQQYVEGAKGDIVNKQKLASALAEVERLKAMLEATA